MGSPIVEVLTFDGCPHAVPAITLVREVVAALAPQAEVRPVAVADEQEAARLPFGGSPTVLVDGQDMEGVPAKAAALSCRLYGDAGGVPPRWMVEAAILRALRPRHVLFLCVANSARSPMAEGIARSLAPAGVVVSSAGSQPSHVRPEAIRALAEIGIDIEHRRSKSVEEIDATTVDAVVTLCAEEVCPVFLGNVHRVHWGLPDPAAEDGDEEARLHAFRATRDELHRRLSLLFRAHESRS